MCYSVVRLEDNDYPLWNEFVLNSPQGSFFYTTEWANIVSYTFDRPYEIIICQKNDHILAGCLVFVQSKLGYKMITPQAFYPYNGPVLEVVHDSKYQKTIAHHLKILNYLSEYLNNEYDYWILDTSPQVKDVRSFQWNGCQVSPTYNYQINLTDWDACLEKFSQVVRKKVRSAEKHDVKIETSEEIQKFIKMYMSSYKRHNKSPLVTELYLEKFLKMALKLQNVKLYYLREKENILAGRVILQDKKVVYDLLAGSEDPEGFASTYLVYHVLQEHSGTKQMFDFLGADHPSIEEFKRSFGGELVNGYRIINPPRFPLSWMVKFQTHRLERNRKL